MTTAIDKVNQLTQALLAKSEDKWVDSFEMEEVLAEHPNLSVDVIERALNNIAVTGRLVSGRARALAFLQAGDPLFVHKTNNRGIDYVGDGYANPALSKLSEEIEHVSAGTGPVRSSEGTTLRARTRRAIALAQYPEAVRHHIGYRLGQAAKLVADRGGAGPDLAARIQEIIAELNLPTSMPEKKLSRGDLYSCVAPPEFAVRRVYVDRSWPSSDEECFTVETDKGERPFYQDFTALLNDLIGDGLLDEEDAGIVENYFLRWDTKTFGVRRKHFHPEAIDALRESLSAIPDRMIAPGVKDRIVAWVRSTALRYTKDRDEVYAMKGYRKADLSLPFEPQTSNVPDFVQGAGFDYAACAQRKAEIDDIVSSDLPAAKKIQALYRVALEEEQKLIGAMSIRVGPKDVKPVEQEIKRTIAFSDAKSHAHESSYGRGGGLSLVLLGFGSYSSGSSGSASSKSKSAQYEFTGTAYDISDQIRHLRLPGQVEALTRFRKQIAPHLTDFGHAAFEIMVQLADPNVDAEALAPGIQDLINRAARTRIRAVDQSGNRKVVDRWVLPQLPGAK